MLMTIHIFTIITFWTQDNLPEQNTANVTPYRNKQMPGITQYQQHVNLNFSNIIAFHVRLY